MHLASGLARHDMDVVIYSMKWWNEAPGVATTPAGSLTYVAICPLVPMYRGSKRSFFQAIVFAVSSFRLLTRKFDLIEADHMPYLQILPLRVVAWIKRVPLVITWHEVWGREGWRTYVGRVGFAAALLERLCMRLPDRIVAASAGTARKLIAEGAKKDRVDVVLNAIDVDQLRMTTANSSAPELLFVGRLIDHKKADLAIEATRLLVERGHNIRLGIVGVGPEAVRLADQVFSSGLSERVTFYHEVESQSDLWSLMQGARVLLAPSIREGFGLAVAESLTLGTPVVCALHPENESSHLVGPLTGSAVPALDATALANAAEHWLMDDSRRTDRVSAFMSEHAELTIDAMSLAYAQIFRRVA